VIEVLLRFAASGGFADRVDFHVGALASIRRESRPILAGRRASPITFTAATHATFARLERRVRHLLSANGVVGAANRSAPASDEKTADRPKY